MKNFCALFACLILAACGTTQSIVKSIFPYTTNIVIPVTSETDKEYEITSQAKSFDQLFARDGNNAYKLSAVHISSAKVQAILPANFNVGNLSSIKVYMAKPDGKDEVLVASRTDIGPNQNRSLVLDIDNSGKLDQLVRQPTIRVRVVYKLRQKVDQAVTLRIALGINATPAD